MRATGNYSGVLYALNRSNETNGKPHPSTSLRAGLLAHKNAREMGHPSLGVNGI